MAKEKDFKEEVTEDIKKLWGEALKSLRKLSEEAAELAKRKEGEVVKASKKLSEKAMTLAKKGEEKLIGVRQMGKFSLDLVSLRRKKEDKLKEIGNKVCQVGPDKVAQSSLKKLCREVKKIESEIKKKEKAVKALKKVIKGTSKPGKKKK